jgi:NADH-quinone oxidoreductase subunit L
MGNLRKYLPITFITMVTGWLAICGIPIWAGFFSKDEILYRTLAAPNLPGNWNYVLWGIGLLTAVLTAVYMTRLMIMTFFGEERFHLALPDSDTHDAAHAEEAAFASGEASDDETHHSIAGDDDHDDEHHALPADFHPHESPANMTIPLVVLAVLSTVGGLVGIPYAMSSMFGAGDINVFQHTLEPVIYHRAANIEHAVPAMAAPGEHAAAPASESAVAEHPTAETVHATHSAEEISTERLLAGLSVLLALVGIGIGWMAFSTQPLRRLPRILVEKWRIDELYNGYIVDPITTLSREGFWKGFDLGFIDGIVNGAGYFTIAMGSILRRVQVGFIRSYAAIILLGALVVLGYFIYFGYRLIS